MDRQPIPADQLPNQSSRQFQLSADLADVAMNGGLTPATGEQLLKVSVLVARDAAIKQLVALIDPGRSRSRWALAVELEQRLERFERDRWPMLRYSARQPADRIEVLLVAIMRAPGPRCARRLADLL